MEEQEITLAPSDAAALTAEKNLRQAYWLSVRKLPSKWHYWASPALVGIFAAFGGWRSGLPAHDLGERVRDWSSVGFSFAYSVVGILLAGFAIFTTVALSDFVPALTKQKKSNGLSEMKNIGLHFVSVFFVYLLFVAFHVFVLLFGWHGGPATMLCRALDAHCDSESGRLLASLLMGIVGWALSSLVISLYVFVYNVYSSFNTLSRMNAAQYVVESEPPKS